MSDLIELRKQMIKHQEADGLVQGHWWSEEDAQGCFYGCAVESNESSIDQAIEKFGIEPWLAYWSEAVFEGLEQETALAFPVEFLDALIPISVDDYDDIYHKLAIKRLESSSKTGDDTVDRAVVLAISYHKNPTEQRRQGVNELAQVAYESARNTLSACKAKIVMHGTNYMPSQTKGGARSALHYSELVVGDSCAEKERKWMLDILKNIKPEQGFE